MEFREWLNQKFIEWERNGGRRSTYAAFARYLGVNTVNYTRWRNGDSKPEIKNISKLAEKLGEEVYDVLGYKRPGGDPLVLAFPDMNEKLRERLAAAISEINDRSDGIPDSDPRIDEIIKDAFIQNGFKL